MDYVIININKLSKGQRFVFFAVWREQAGLSTTLPSLGTEPVPQETAVKEEKNAAMRKNLFYK